VVICAKTAEPIGMSFGLWVWMGPRKVSCVRWGLQVLGNVAMATNFWLSMGYNFDCMIVSDTLFDSRAGFSRSSYSLKTQPTSSA